MKNITKQISKNIISKNIATFVLFLLLLIPAFFSTPYLSAAPEPQNIIIISVDTLRADHLGCYGYPVNTSPVIDAFSKDAVLFSNCYTLTPLTTPSFSTMMTSLPPHKHGAKRNGLSVYKKVKTLPHFLKRYGYKTAAVISNWPLRKRLAGLHTGFDFYYQIFHRKRYMGLMNSEGQAPSVTKKAVEWLRKNHKKRFFLWVQYTDPHALYIMHNEFAFDYSNVPPSTYPPKTRMKKIKRYDSEIAFADFYIGRFLDELKKLGLYENALILFHADHGESFGEHNYFKHGRKLYNSTLHVPLIIKLPGNRLKNTRRNENVCIMDIGPTIFNALDIPVFSQMEGLPLFDTEPSELAKRKILLQAYGGAVTFKRKSKKYQLKVKPIRYGVLKNNTKLIFNPKSKRSEAYDVDNDAFEIHNIFSMTSKNWPFLKQLQTHLTGKIMEIKKFIKMKRVYNKRQGELSEEDMEKLKSLGYF